MADVTAGCASTQATAIWAMDMPAAAASGRSASTVANSRSCHLVGVVVRAAHVARLPRPHHVVERAQRLVHRRLRVGVMDLVEVDVVGAEAPERALDGV